MEALEALEELGLEDDDVDGDGEAEDGCFCEVDVAEGKNEDVVVGSVGGLTGII